jgi:hypothetical protein
MVHALKDIWRVLVHGGTLIDLRPIHADWLLEVVAENRVISIGAVDNAQHHADDLAANQALQQLVAEGVFRCERQESFRYAWYWDTSTEMRTYFENKSPPLCIPQEMLQKTQNALQNAGQNAQVRVLIRMSIARYRKAVGQETIGHIGDSPCTTN